MSHTIVPLKSRQVFGKKWKQNLNSKQQKEFYISWQERFASFCCLLAYSFCLNSFGYAESWLHIRISLLLFQGRWNTDLYPIVENLHGENFTPDRPNLFQKNCTARSVFCGKRNRQRDKRCLRTKKLQNVTNFWRQEVPSFARERSWGQSINLPC